jgi:hypothetical protein
MVPYLNTVPPSFVVTPPFIKPWIRPWYGFTDTHILFSYYILWQNIAFTIEYTIMHYCPILTKILLTSDDIVCMAIKTANRPARNA